MQAQLDKMKTTGKQTEEMIATNKSLAAAAEKAADVARQTLIAAQRAWIRTDQIGFGGGGVAIDVNGASVSVSLKITNTGNTPAIKVTPQAWLVVWKSGGPSPWQEQQRRCGEIRGQPFATTGFTLFPGESFPSNIGNLYGTTQGGGASLCFGSGWGVVFTLSPSGTETVLYSFTGSDGAFPLVGLIADSAGNLYGT